MPEYKLKDYEVKRELKTFEVSLTCSKCGVGHMKCNGEAQLSLPPRYYHICDSLTCANIEFHSKSYPYIKHEV